MVGAVSLTMAVSVTGCRSSPDPAGQLCMRALGSAVVSAGPVTTLGEVRQLTEGPGYQPAKSAFPELPASTVAAWCWTRNAALFDSFAALPGGKKVKLASIGGTATPTGAPVIP